jgi:aryl-alcohol dehydrogenase-like predicted oxidoreductase
MATVGLAWVLKNPVVAAPIVGATKEKHLTDAAAALDIELTVDELVRLGEPYLIREPTYF